ncbi:MAG: hypothetical protein HFI88_14740 [Lachnospiraceae bacterium]|nr:hypothetical protein [Lachnospiraceae bacterium]
MNGYIEDAGRFDRQLKKRRFSEAVVKLFQPKSPTSNLFKKCIKAIVRLLVKAMTTYERAVKRYWDVIGEYDEVAEKVSLMTHVVSFILQYNIYKTDFEDIIYVDFENISIPVPASYDRVLKDIYGDYMDFPPVDERGEWHNGIIDFDPDLPYKEYFKNKVKQR